LVVFVKFKVRKRESPRNIRGWKNLEKIKELGPNLTDKKDAGNQGI